MDMWVRQGWSSGRSSTETLGREAGKADCTGGECVDGREGIGQRVRSSKGEKCWENAADGIGHVPSKGCGEDLIPDGSQMEGH